MAVNVLIFKSLDGKQEDKKSAVWLVFPELKVLSFSFVCIVP